ncbi:MAG: S1/P1 nuclease [Oceanospirillaceae bacterium]|nr:S1/P1 nuclease [Oceanospirillaceae bacterium]MCP5334701.1 S1/P1 nuclease [Oceanospirillaceae bacterium]MCP5351305.1 S1/P1 nuclease [Oceanospirillaceae bacterium]
MKKIIISLLFVSISQWACAFSDRGHELVAELAWDRLTPFAREQVARILGPGKQNFVKASVWADKVKGDERFDYLKPMHYVNLEANKYNQQNDCPDRRCVVAAIEDFSVMVVKGDRREQQLALRMLVHLIADIHQPLHAGDAKDRGGNWINITYRGDEMKLHQAWDDELINPSGLSEDALFTQLMAIPAKDFDLAGPVVWAEESHKLAKQLAYQATDKSVLSEDYISRSELMLQRQLALAGWRLAMWLNQVW